MGVKFVNDFFNWFDGVTQPAAAQSAHRGNYDLYKYKVDKELAKITAWLNQIDSLLKDKANKLHLSDTTHSLDTSDYRFPLRIWRNYVDGGSYNNSYNGLLHIHNDEGRLKVSIKKDYYDLKLPSHNSDEWKGNIIEHEQFNLSTGDTLISTDNYILYQLPARWVKPGESTCFIKKSGKKKVSVYSVQSNRFTELSDNGVSSVIALTNDDNVHIDGILEICL